MTYAVFASGFVLAVLVILVMAALWLLAKGRLQSWDSDLTRETHSLLRDTNLKLDTIKFQQERALSRLERLERTVGRAFPPGRLNSRKALFSSTDIPGRPNTGWSGLRDAGLGLFIPCKGINFYAW